MQYKCCVATIVLSALAFTMTAAATRGTEWKAVAKGIAQNAQGQDRLGVAVAADGDTYVVGAPGQGEHGSEGFASYFGPGAVYVFAPEGNKLVQHAKLIASDATPGDLFGASVGIGGDTIVVGAEMVDGVGRNSGAIYVFQRHGTEWAQQAKLTASDGAAGEEFGRAVAISGDTIVVGADDAAGEALDSGAAYVFERRGDRWIQQAKLTAQDGQEDDEFGHSAAISGDTIVIGAFGADHAAGANAGAAYVFERREGVWVQQVKLTASDAAEGDNFGGDRGTFDGHSGVAISGNTIVVGAENADAPDRNSGAVYVFQRAGTAWTEQAKLTASDAAEGDDFAESVAISGDTIVVGADDAAGEDVGTGAAYVFHRRGTTWTQEAKIVAEDGQDNDKFGTSVAISGDAIVVGAYGDDHGDGRYAGSVYVFSAAADR